MVRMRTGRLVGEGWPVIAGVAWFMAVAAGMVAVFAYSGRPGDEAHAPSVWPAAVTLAREAGKPTVVMLAHPKCPCTRASLNELAQIVTRSEHKAAFHVLFMQPDGVDEAWAQSDSYGRARSLPGVVVTIDRHGATAAKLGVTTSGHVVVYDAAGTLRFSGGITSARGHEGDNVGRQSVIALVSGEEGASASTKTFGCDLRETGPAGVVQR